MQAPQAMSDRLVTLRRNLADARSGRVVFVSHCLLNQNVRYLGGAGRPGVVREILERYTRDGDGICQMACPEQRAWGGVLKRYLLASYGRRIPRGARSLFLALFRRYTQRIYRRLARDVARAIADYERSGFVVTGVVAVAGSPSCGAGTTLDLRGALDTVAACPLAALDRRYLNERVIAAHEVPGDGWFVAALRRALRRRGLGVSIVEARVPDPPNA